MSMSDTFFDAVNEIDKYLSEPLYTNNDPDTLAQVKTVRDSMYNLAYVLAAPPGYVWVPAADKYVSKYVLEAL